MTDPAIDLPPLPPFPDQGFMSSYELGRLQEFATLYGQECARAAVLAERESAKERGPWSVMVTPTEVFAASDDFTHDVCLKVSGNFESAEQKHAYAAEICRRLNASTPEDA